ncbi:hypothetical protein OKW40_007367 [Paraburkholderia sp. RAU6.4a]
MGNGLAAKRLPDQDHRAIKRVIKPMMGFKSFRFARIILSGIEVMHMIRKGADAARWRHHNRCRAILFAGHISNPLHIKSDRTDFLIATKPILQRR